MHEIPLISTVLHEIYKEAEKGKYLKFYFYPNKSKSIIPEYRSPSPKGIRSNTLQNIKNSDTAVRRDFLISCHAINLQISFPGLLNIRKFPVYFFHLLNSSAICCRRYICSHTASKLFCSPVLHSLEIAYDGEKMNFSKNILFYH